MKLKSEDENMLGIENIEIPSFGEETDTQGSNDRDSVMIVAKLNAQNEMRALVDHELNDSVSQEIDETLPVEQSTNNLSLRLDLSDTSDKSEQTLNNEKEVSDLATEEKINTLDAVRQDNDSDHEAVRQHRRKRVMISSDEESSDDTKGEKTKDSLAKEPSSTTSDIYFEIVQTDTSQTAAQPGTKGSLLPKALDTDLYDAETDESDDEDAANISRVSAKTRRVIIHSSDEDEPSPSRGDKTRKSLFDADSTTEPKAEIKRKVLESDLYDADMDESDDDDDAANSCRKTKRSAILSSDEDDPLFSRDEDCISSSLQLDNNDDKPKERKTKKGARSPKPRKLKKEAIQKIHSESQRIVRESQVRLPYHKPKQLSLDELFNKRPSGIALKPLRGLLGLQKKEEEDAKKNLKKDCDLELIDPFSTNIENALQEMDSCVEKDNAANPGLDSSASLGVTETLNVSLQITESAVSPIDENNIELGEKKLDIDDTELLEAEDRMISSQTEHQEQTLRLQLSQETILTQETQDVNQTKENPLPQSKGQHDAITISQQNVDISTSKETSISKRKNTMKLLQESLAKLKNMKPYISGETEGIVDLGEEVESGPMPKGIENFMQRFTHHALRTGHKKHKANKEVLVSIITKETGADGKENLKQEFIPVKLNGEEEDDADIKMKIPGAKLIKLKETLKAKMKAKREEERQKRQVAYRLDNEDLLGEDEEEEEEDLTDNETSDEDYKVDEEEEDDDEELMDYKQDEHKEKCAFVDDEAEDDNDDEMDDEEIQETYEFLSKEDNSDSDNDEISPSRKLKKKKIKHRQLLSDDEDEMIEAKPLNNFETEKIGEKQHSELPPAEHSNLSSISSKTSSLRRSDAGSLTLFPADVGKTVDLYDSTTSFQDEAATSSGAEEEKLTSFDLSDLKEKAEVSTSSKSRSLKQSDSSSLTDVGKTVDLFNSASSLQRGTTLNRVTAEKKLTSFDLSGLKRQDSADTSEISPKPITSVADLDASFDMFPSTIPPYQPRRESSEDAKSKEFTPFSAHRSLLSQSSAKNAVKPNELTMPVEDSQDLFRLDSPLPSSDFHPESETQSFKFSFEDDFTQTQFLDENGFLNTKSSSKPVFPKQIFNDENASQANMDELLGLCSGQFSGSSQRSETNFKKGMFSHNSQDNMEELLGLCSGNFSAKPPQATQKTDDEKSADSDNGSIALFGILSYPEATNQKKDDGEGLSSDDEPIIIKRKKKKLKKKLEETNKDDADLHLAFESDEEFETVEEKQFQKLATRKFFEQEAELSGSDFESDEDYDADDLADELEIDKEAEEDVKDQDELREQVNQIYMKNVDDEDARRLRIYKEMYLPDGDLYSEGKGRVRRFRWKHLDEEMDGDGKDQANSDDEKDEEGDEDTQWRLQRYQREQWLKDKENGEENGKLGTSAPVEDVEDENSQFDLFMKSAVRNQRKGSMSTQSSSSDSILNDKAVSAEKIFTSPKPPKMHKYGSFLKRKKKELEQLAAVVKPITNPGAARNNRGFVFQSLSQNSKEPAEMSLTPPQMKRSLSVTEPSRTQSKKPRLDRSISHKTPASIFHHL